MKTQATSVTTLKTKDHLVRAQNLSDYISSARDEVAALNVQWDEPYWTGVGYFVKQAHAPRGSLKKGIDRAAWLDSSFADFAKAYVTTQHLNNPGESRSGHIKRLQTLRLLEAALLELRGSADPLQMDAAVFDATAFMARSQLKGSGPYRVGAELVTLAAALVEKGILPAVCASWSNPNKQPKNNSISVDPTAERARQLRLPDSEALYALADIFNRDLDVADKRVQADIVATSAIALLMCAPSRGQEIFRLPVNLKFEATDKFGKDQKGLRLHASKGFGAYIKWVWSEMVPVAERAIERVQAMTEDARNLARHLENPATCGKFFRHADCPQVPDDEPLTASDVCRALGYRNASPAAALNKIGLSAVGGSYTLQTLWDTWVLPQHRKLNPHFPYVSARDAGLGKKGGLKFSDALFCMFRHQLSLSSSTSPVLLWMPELTDLSFRLRGSKTIKSIFDRYGYLGRDGQPVTLTSHQIRHLLNTEAQRVGLSDEQIAHWSGRARVSQNAVYDHRTTAERVEQTREAVAQVQSAVSLIGSDQGQAKSYSHGPWVVQVVRKPRSASDIEDIQPHLTGLKTLYGECHHDWAFAPCEGFVKCLDCSEHACIKGSDEDAATKLERLQVLHRSVLKEVEKARLASQDDVDAQEWLHVQQRHADKVAQLITLLQSEAVPDGSIIRTAQGQSPTHLRRAMRGLARRALSEGTAPQAVMEQMLENLDSGRGSTSLQITSQVAQ